MKLVTLAVLATVAVAAPTTTAAAITTTEAKTFSFSQWVDDILNPNVAALTPEQAIEAYYQSINGTASTNGGAAKVTKRFNRVCWSDDSTHSMRPTVDNAVKCVSSLAALGDSVTYSVEARGDRALCLDIPNTVMHIYPTSYDVKLTAKQVAIAGGHLMDGCTYGGTTGGSIYEDFAHLTKLNLGRY